MNDGDNTNFPIVALGQIGGSAIQTVNGRDLHASLGVGRLFAAWLPDRIEQYGFTENIDFVVFSETGKNSSGGRPAKEYALSLDMAKELAMVERNDQGKLVRRYFIECERKVQSADPVRALSDPSSLRTLLLQNVEKVLALESKVAEQQGEIEAVKPKAEFYDQFASSDGLYGLQNAARVLDQPPNKFIRWLKQEHLFYQGGSLVPYRQFRERGIFEVKAEIVDDKALHRTWVTPKGIEYFAKKLGAPAVATAH